MCHPTKRGVGGLHNAKWLLQFCSSCCPQLDCGTWRPLKQRAAKHEPTCRGAAVKRHAPEAPTYDGHAVASGFHFKCHLSTLEKQVISGSSGGHVFPWKRPNVGTVPCSVGVLVCHQPLARSSPQSRGGLPSDVVAACPNVASWWLYRACATRGCLGNYNSGFWHMKRSIIMAFVGTHSILAPNSLEIAVRS